MKNLQNSSIKPIVSRNASIANSVLNACYELNTIQRAMIFMTLARVNPHNPIDLGKWYSMNVEEYAMLRGIEKKNAYEVLQEGCEDILNRIIVIKSPDGKTTTKLHWVSGVRFNKEQHLVELQWAPTIVEFIGELKEKYTQFHVKDVVKIDGRYAARLFDMVAQEKYRGKTGKKFVRVEDIVFSWNVPEYAREYKYLKSKVLVPAMKELEKKELCKVRVRDTGGDCRKGRKVERVEVEWEFLV